MEWFKDVMFVFYHCEILYSYMKDVIVSNNSEALMLMKYLLMYLDHNLLYTEFMELTGISYDITTLSERIFTLHDYEKMCVVEKSFCTDVIADSCWHEESPSMLSFLSTQSLRSVFSQRYGTRRNELPRTLLIRLLANSGHPSDYMFLQIAQKEVLECFI